MDEIIRAVSKDGFVKISVVTARDAVQRANAIHHCSPTAIAALGRSLCAASMLGDLLEISRFDAGAADLTTDDIDLGDLVEAEMHAQQAMAAAVGSELVLHRTGPCVVEADARRVQRIVRNLLSNAISHGEHRQITLTVAGDLRAVALTVRD